MNDKGLKILLIEDNAGDVRLIREMLAEVEGMSYNLEPAGRLSAGLERLTKQQFDVVLLDLGLPDSQGLETLNKIYTQTPTTPIVVLTGLGDEVIANRAVREGAQDYLVKGDINGSALWRIIRYAIERKRAEEALRRSEEIYHSLYSTMREGAALHEVIYDESGKPIDYVILDVNPQYESILGLSRDKAIGSKASELYGVGEAPYLDIYARVAQYRESTHFETYFPPMDKHFSISVFSPDKGKFATVFTDITERKRAEEVLRQSEEKHRVLFETMVQGVVYQSANGKIFSANPAAERILGLTLDQMQGRTSMDPRWKAIHEDGSDFPGETHPSIIALKTGKEVKDVVMGVFNPGDEQYHWINICAIPQFRPGESKPYQVYATFEDITERKQAEEALRLSMERYRILFDTNIDGLCVMDETMKVLLVNEAATRIFGFESAEEVLKVNPFDFIPSQERERVLETITKDMFENDKKQVNEFQLVNKSGKEAWVSAVGAIVEYQGKPAGLISFSDITKRKQAEEALRQSEEKYRSLFEESIDPVFISTREGIIVDVNQAMLNLFGYTREELIGTDVRKVYFNPKGRHYFQQKIEQKGFIKDWEVKFRKKDGTEVECLLTSVVRWGDDKNILGYQGIIRDISERKLAEAERNEIEQKAELASRLASIGEMASGIAHEINNPLTGVIGYAQLLSKKELPEDIKEGLEVINDGAQRVAGIIKRLLTFARQYKPERTLANINNIIETTLDLRSYQLKTNNIKLTTRLAPDLPTTIADAGQLQQVFLNLIVNAETEMKQAHGKGKLSVRTEQMDNIIRISFKDDGPGIMKKNLERIFSPFFTTRKIGEGTGLGLSVCHGIIAEHGGRIYAESKLGKGATFIIELPMITADEQMELPELIAEEPQKITNARILVVDDEPGVRQFLGQALTDEGHEVQTVDNSSDALERIKSQRYSLILLDIKMPDMSGIELYERIQKISQSLAGRVVFITGDVLGINTAAFLSKTKAPHIVKPFDAEQLKKDISCILTEGARGWTRRHGKAQV